jgi:membrane protein implicated in regulation of membrane protease activity
MSRIAPTFGAGILAIAIVGSVLHLLGIPFTGLAQAVVGVLGIVVAWRFLRHVPQLPRQATSPRPAAGLFVLILMDSKAVRW